MNYIRHLTTFFEKIYPDNRLNANHVSLYMALFQFWNLNRFENPFKINRSEIMKLSKIGSINTYHKCLHDLHQLGYIKYEPSFNPLKGSGIFLYNFDKTDSMASNTGTLSKTVQEEESSRLKTDTPVLTGNEPLIKQNKQKNNKTREMKNPQTTNHAVISDSNPENNENSASSAVRTGKTDLPGQKEKSRIPPTQEQVKTFFNTHNFPPLEAQKFFNHFQSNGWRVGGKSPMKDWHAAARNWMINYQKFNATEISGSTHLNTNKRYDIPL